MELIQEIGSYAGFAAVLGLAVLSALYFSQARDLKRLREWAGRAPERDAEARARVAAAGAVAATPAAQPQTGQAQPAKPAAKPATAAAGNSGGNSTATPTPTPTPVATPTPAATPAAAAAAKAPAIGAGGAGRPATATAARPAQRVSAQTSILRGQQPDPLEPWYRRIAPRYIALIVAGVLVVGGGIAVGVVQLLGDDTGGGSTPAAEEREGGGEQSEQAASAPLRPADISVAVLNATPVPGLAAQFGDRVESEGFQRDNVGNFNGGQRAESVVLYAPGRKRHASLVRRRFDVNAIEPVDEQLRSQVSPNADVFLVVGADKTQ